MLQPSLDLDAVHVVVLRGKIKLRALAAVLDDVPPVGGRGGFVDDHQPGGALAGSLFILVGPAAVVGHRVAIEQFRVFRGEARVIDQHDHGLAADVQAGVVVPAVLGRDDAVARPYQFAALQPGLFDDTLGPHGDFGAVGVDPLEAFAAHGESGLGNVFHRHKRHGLAVAVAEHRLQPHVTELGFEKVQCQTLAFGHRGTTAELVRGQRANFLQQAVRFDPGHGMDGRR